MSDFLSDFSKGGVYATITEANVASMQNLVGQPTQTSVTGWSRAAKIGSVFTVDLEGGVQCVGEVTSVDLDTDTVHGVITKVQAIPEPIDYDDEDDDA